MAMPRVRCSAGKAKRFYKTMESDPFITNRRDPAVQGLRARGQAGTSLQIYYLGGSPASAPLTLPVGAGLGRMEGEWNRKRAHMRAALLDHSYPHGDGRRLALQPQF